VSDNRRVRLDTPRDTRRRIVRRPSLDADAFGVFAESFARYMGTATFLIWMTMFVTAWFAWNTLAPKELRWDEFPFIFLTLILSLQASYAAPLILLAQNRQADRDRVQTERDRLATERNQAEVEYLTREIAGLRHALGDLATRDFLRDELEHLLNELRRPGEREQDR
jgi:uncharacterized membrane protein